MFKPILSLSVTVLMVVSLTACSNSSSNEDKGSFPNFSAQNVSPNGCLDLALIQQRLNSGSYPALAVTTDFQTDSSLSTRKELFHAYSALDARNIATSDIAVFLNPAQSGCNQVTANTASGEQLVYKVTSSSENSISIEIQNPADEAMSSYRLKALKKKMHPTKYKVEILSPTHLRVATTYRGFDAHCRGSKAITSTVQKDYIWGRSAEELPAQVQVKDRFYQKAISAVKTSGGSFTPLPTPADGTPVDSGSTVTPEYTMPGTPENPWLPQPVSLATLNEVVPNSDYRTVDLQEIRTLVAKPAKDEIVKCTH